MPTTTTTTIASEPQSQSPVSFPTPLPTTADSSELGFVSPPRKLMKKVFSAVAQYNMIEEGDRILLGLSGGKDSLTMLHVFAELQKKLKTKFEFAACTVDPHTASYNPRNLISYLDSLGVTYHYLEEDIIDLAKKQNDGRGASSICSFCSRMKRGMIYTLMRNEKYNKLAFAHHLDDLVESFFMSFMHNGSLNTMKANYVIDKGDLRMIRPLLFVREDETKEFAYGNNLPIISENCPACFQQPQERARIKKVIASQEVLFPSLFPNLIKAMKPLYEQTNQDGNIGQDHIRAVLEQTQQARKVQHQQEAQEKQQQEQQQQEDNVNTVESISTTTAATTVGISEPSLESIASDVAQTFADTAAAKSSLASSSIASDLALVAAETREPVAPETDAVTNEQFAMSALGVMLFSFFHVCASSLHK